MKKMKKILCSLVSAIAFISNACWFTAENFDGNYIAGVNNYYAHYTETSSILSAVYYNGGKTSLPLTVYVKISPRLSGKHENALNPIQIAMLQYKVKHNGQWGQWVTVKTFTNLTWDLSFVNPVPLFGRKSINPKNLVKNDEIMIRLYLFDGVYETGDLETDPGEIPNEATVNEGGFYEGGWTAPFVFRVTFNGQYWK